MQRLEIRTKDRFRSSTVEYAVFRGNSRLSDWASEGVAQKRLTALQNDDARKTRTCLCCRESFLSAGPHNRMCTACRGISDAGAPYAIGR